MRLCTTWNSSRGFVAITLVAASAVVWARPVQLLSLEEQYKEASLVVIGTAIVGVALHNQGGADFRTLPSGERVVHQHHIAALTLHDRGW